jgi:hypothetical protein
VFKTDWRALIGDSISFKRYILNMAVSLLDGGDEQGVALAPHGDNEQEQQSRFKALTDVFVKLKDNASHNFKNVRDVIW